MSDRQLVWCLLGSLDTLLGSLDRPAHTLLAVFCVPTMETAVLTAVLDAVVLVGWQCRGAVQRLLRLALFKSYRNPAVATDDLTKHTKINVWDIAGFGRVVFTSRWAINATDCRQRSPGNLLPSAFRQASHLASRFAAALKWRTVCFTVQASSL